MYFNFGEAVLHSDKSGRRAGQCPYARSICNYARGEYAADPCIRRNCRAAPEPEPMSAFLPCQLRPRPVILHITSHKEFTLSIANELLIEFEEQAPITRRFLERLPQNKLTWKPHEKSPTAGQLAHHLAVVPAGVISGAQKSEVPPPNVQFPQPESVREILDAV